MKEITDMLGVQRSILAELRRTRETVERIEKLLARRFESPLFDPRSETTYIMEYPGFDPGWVCGNSMHLHRSKEDAEACPDHKK